jgi:hypothetical protein
MSLDDENWDRAVDPWWDDDEYLEIKREQQLLDLIEEDRRSRHFLIRKLDDENSWELVSKFLATQAEDDHWTLTKEEEMEQQWKDVLFYKLRLTDNLKEYLLYQFILVRDFGICVGIFATLIELMRFVSKFVPNLTHS